MSTPMKDRHSGSTAGRIRALRDEGMALKAIMDEVGVSYRAVRLALDPEGQKERERRDNARRNKAKQQAWRGKCERCGREASTPRTALCTTCRDETQHGRRVEHAMEMLRLRREEDLSNIQIAAKVGVAVQSVAQELCRLRTLGFDVPLAPYARRRGWAPTADAVTADTLKLAHALRTCGYEIPNAPSEVAA